MTAGISDGSGFPLAGSFAVRSRDLRDGKEGALVFDDWLSLGPDAGGAPIALDLVFSRVRCKIELSGGGGGGGISNDGRGFDVDSNCESKNE